MLAQRTKRRTMPPSRSAQDLPRLVLVNGLAGQMETWHRNLAAWRKHFEVHAPEISAYDGEVMQARIAQGLPLDIDYFVERLHQYVVESLGGEAVCLLANSMGGKVAVEFAVRYPRLVERLVLLCPSGLADEERLPLVAGVRHHDAQAVVASVFHDPSLAAPPLVEYYRERFADKRWRTGLLRTIRGTMDHSVRDRLADVTQPTLLVVGSEDRIVDPRQSLAAGRRLRRGRLVELAACGHAPQIERADEVNRLVVEFLAEGRSSGTVA